MALNQGAAGVRIKLLDNSAVDTLTNTNTTAGVVGFSSRGAFNRILRLTSPSQMDTILGNGFNKSYFNQGLYAARGVLNSGGTVEFVRPYGETVDLTSTNARVLNSDTFLVKYTYNIESNATVANIPVNSIVMNHFASTRCETDGFASFGKREIYTVDQAITESSNVNFFLNSNEVLDSDTNIKTIALFAIINEDPTAADRATDSTDTTADNVVMTTATYKTAHTVTDVLTYDGTTTPTTGDTFTVIDNAGVVTTFEFSDVHPYVGANVAIDIGTVSAFLSTTAIMANIVTAVMTALPYATVTSSVFDLTVVQYFGINDAYNSSTQNKVFTNGSSLTYLNPGFSGSRAVVVDSYIVLNSGFGRNFLNLGLANDSYVKDSYTDTSYTRHFALTTVGQQVAQIYLQVDYTFYGQVFTFAGTIVPYVYQDVNLFIGDAADAVAVGFKFLINESDDLSGSTEDTQFNLGQSLSAFTVDQATTANVALTAEQTIDGVLTATSRVLVKNQTIASQNGIYLTSAGAWTRAVDFNTSSEVVNGVNVFVKTGTVGTSAVWRLTTANPILLGSTSLTFTQLHGQPVVVAAASTANLTLSGPQTVDVISLTAGMTVLVKDQTTTSQNGIYTVQSGSWTRTADTLVNGMFVSITAGTTNGGRIYELTTANPIVPDTTLLTFTRVYSSLTDADLVNDLLTSSFSKNAYDVNDPALNFIWTYDPRNNRSSTILGDAFGLFLDKDSSDVDMLVAAGTDIDNLGVRNSEQIDYNVMNAILTICDQRKDCFAIFDGVDELNINTALRKMVGISGEGDIGKWGAIFDGRSIFFDSVYTKSNVEAVKSIEMAAIITNNRAGGSYWIPPAGMDFGTIPGAFATKQKYVRSYNFADDPNSDVAMLYDANINPTRTTANGMIIYGQKTMLKRSSALNRLNVIMLVAGMHKKFEVYLDSKVFNLNTAALRASIVSTLNTEIQRLLNANPAGLYAGKVICDDTNNTPTTIDLEELFVDVIIQPTKAAEFITLRTTVQRTGDDLTVSSVEIIGG